MSQLAPQYQPQNLIVTVNGQSSVTLAWSRVAGSTIQTYNVYRDGKIIASPLASTPTYTDSEISANRHYNYAVSSVDGSGNESPQTPIQRAEVLTASTLGFIISWVEQPGMAGRPDTQWFWY